jgi:hypothetical protein
MHEQEADPGLLGVANDERAKGGQDQAGEHQPSDVIGAAVAALVGPGRCLVGHRRDRLRWAGP